MLSAFLGVAAGIVLGLLWGNGEVEGGTSFSMAIPCAIIGGLAGLGIGHIRSRRSFTILGAGAGALLGAAWGAASPDGIPAILIMAGILGALGTAAGYWIGRERGGTPPAYASLPYYRTGVGLLSGVVLGLLWGSATYDGGGELSLAWFTGAIGGGAGFALDRATGEGRLRLWSAMRYAAGGFFIGAWVLGTPEGNIIGALLGLAGGFCLGWFRGPAIASAVAWRPPSDDVRPLAPPEWIAAAARKADTLRMPLTVGLGFAALVLFAHSVDAAVEDFKSANLISGTFAAACALVYATRAVHCGFVRRLGHAFAVPAGIAGPGLARMLTFVRRWRLIVVLAAIYVGSAIVADSFQATYIHYTSSQSSRTHTEYQGGDRYQVTTTTTTWHRRERGGETQWIPLIVGLMVLSGANRLHKGIRAGNAGAAARAGFD